MSAAAAARGRAADEREACPAGGASGGHGNVVAFPRVALSAAPAELAPLAWVIIGLRRVGEPATSGEILNAVASAALELNAVDQRSIEAVLACFSRGDNGLRLFQQVRLRDSEAWGFTPGFRFALRRAGLQPVHRGE